MYSYITVKIYSVNIIENRCTFVENKNEFFLLSRFHNRKRVFPHTFCVYYAFIPTTQIICTVDIIYTLHIRLHLSTRLYISIYSNRLVLILTNIPDLGHPHKSCLPQFYLKKKIYKSISTYIYKVHYTRLVRDTGKSISFHSPVTKHPKHRVCKI